MTNYENLEVDESIKNRIPPWADKLDKKNLLSFVHIPKAGGMSFNAHLAYIYGCYMVKYHSQFNPNLFEETTPESSREILCISSHYGFGIHRFFGSNKPLTPKDNGDGLFSDRTIRYVTIVRNPLERMVSYYNFVTTFEPHHHYKMTNKMDIYEFYDYLDQRNDIELKNLQCYLITGRSSRKFEDARKIIDHHYFAAAPVEKSTEFIEYLNKKLKWPDDVQYIIRNVSPKKITPKEIEPQLKKFLLKSNSEDYKLYNYVAEKFDNLMKLS